MTATPLPRTFGRTAAVTGNSSTGRNLRLVALVVLVVLVVAAAIAAVQLFRARQHLSAGAQDLTTAIDAIRAPSRLRDPAYRSQSISKLTAARNEFAAARNDLMLWTPILDHSGWVPSLGPQLKAASPAATAAYYATSSALDIVQGANGIWPALTPRHHVPILARLAPALVSGHQDFSAAEAQARLGISALAGLPVSTGNSGLNTALAKLRRDLPRLNTAAVWLSAAPTLLGWNAPQRYLVALENSAEIRPVGGFIGAADLLTVHKGYLTKRFTGASLPHEIPFHHLPLQEAELTSESDWLFRDSNASPDFPTSARLERWFYGQDTGRWANGVLDFIDLGVADLLQKLGPLYVPQYHLTVTPQNAQALAQRFAGPGSVTTAYRGPQTVGSPDTLRKQFLGFELSAMLSKLESLPSSRWSALAGALSLLVAKHDLLFYDRNPTVEQATIASGDSGSLTPRVGDFVYIVDDNRSYNKLAPYVQEWASYNTEILPDMWQDSVLTIHYHVNPSPANLEGLGPDYGTKGTKHDYEDAVRVFVPPGATLDSISPSVKLFTPSAAQPAYGMMAFSGYFIVREGQSATITFRYHLPANVFSWSGYHHYRLTIPRQPGAELRWMGVHVQTVAGVRLKTPGGALVQSYHAGFPMTQDRVLNLAIGGRTDPQPVPATGPINTGDPFLPLWAFRRYHLHPF